MYVQRQQDATEWGTTLSYDVVCDEYHRLQPMIWDYHSEIVEGYMTEEYSQYFSGNPFMRILRLDNLVSTLEDDEDKAPK